MPISPSNSRLVVEDGWVKPPSAYEYPKGRTLNPNPNNDGVAARVETHRFRNGKLIAKNGLPMHGERLDSTSEVESYDLLPPDD